MANIKISISQFTLLVIVFTIGSSILVAPSGLAFLAKQDAWIASILGVIISLLFILLYGRLAEKFPSLSLVEYCELILGKWLGKLVSLSFLSYFFVLASLLVREIGDFLNTQILPDTPIQFIHMIFLTIVIMGSRLGLEVIARSTEIFFPWIMGMLIVSLLGISPQIKLENIQPIFEGGIKPILQGTFHFIGLPFLELVVFLMIYPYVSNNEKAGSRFLLGTLLSGMILITINSVTIFVLGANTTAENNYPTYILAKRINVADFIQRIEAIIAGIWFLTIYLKITICFYSTALGISQILKLKDFRFLTLPLGIILIAFSLIVSPNIIYFQTFLIQTWTPYSLTFGLFLPLLLLTVTTLKSKLKRTNDKLT